MLTCDAIVVGACCPTLDLKPGFEDVQGADESCCESPGYCTSNEAHNLGVIPVFVLPRLCPGWQVKARGHTRPLGPLSYCRSTVDRTCKVFAPDSAYRGSTYACTVCDAFELTVRALI